MLQSQGWKPGDHLGSPRPYTGQKSDLSTNPIRVQLKDDTLGLGARSGQAKEDGPTTGLAGLQDLLGRLNNKSEGQILQEQRHRHVLQNGRYLERRGALTFISAGFLAQDKIKKDPDKSDAAKGADMDVDLTMKNNQRMKRLYEKPQVEPIRISADTIEPLMSTSLEKQTQLSIDEASAKLEGKAGRAARKEQKRERKRERVKTMKPDISSVSKHNEQAQNLGSETNFRAKEERSKSHEPQDSHLAPESGRRLESRHLVRGRYIRQKKVAMMDTKALNEILMIKS
ncbi:uncharacterized protein KY384_009065 [Bacidia gigantensis]|uniref:uncharacterized protein n=1 Tax=Bacidia gigantensis TaxID=2732470 RepID=UPI001D042542|nr:uncharacterized protein KY384_009065 [Bacidia gigantensis]KAG8525421.1 hypothetical protein KY384_009065 [Bacidia gigantensis]